MLWKSFCRSWAINLALGWWSSPTVSPQNFPSWRPFFYFRLLGRLAMKTTWPIHHFWIAPKKSNRLYRPFHWTSSRRNETVIFRSFQSFLTITVCHPWIDGVTACINAGSYLKFYFSLISFFFFWRAGLFDSGEYSCYPLSQVVKRTTRCPQRTWDGTILPGFCWPRSAHDPTALPFPRTRN